MFTPHDPLLHHVVLTKDEVTRLYVDGHLAMTDPADLHDDPPEDAAPSQVKVPGDVLPVAPTEPPLVLEDEPDSPEGENE